MKAHGKIVLVIIAAIILIPASGILFSDGSDAADNEYTQYYRGQLTYNQSLIYDAMTGLDPSTVAKMSVYGGSEEYSVTVSVPGYTLSTDTYEHLRELVLADAERAWQATLLDDPFAWWAWSTDNAGVALYATTFQVWNSDGRIYDSSVSGIVLYINISESYMTGTTMAEKVTEAETALDELWNGGSVSGDTAVSTIEKINAYLCSRSFAYNENAAFCNNIYGALVAQTDGKHAIICTGYSQLFKALCDRAGIPCINIVGTSAQSNANGAHMWNQVIVYVDGNAQSLAVDTTWNATSGSEKAYLLSGAYTSVNGVTFTQTHGAFAPLADAPGLWADYAFKSPALNGEGYSFPAETDVFATVSEYMPWIFAGIVCIILAYVLWTIGRRGD